MRKLPFLLLGICIVSCDSKNNNNQTIATNLNHLIKIDSLVTMNVINDLQTMLVDAPQVFTISSKTTKTIEGRKGLKVTVNADNLETTDGQPVSGDIQVSIKEMRKATDMIANNCPTISDGKMLVSDGSYYIGMASNGKQLKIKNGRSLQMEFPRTINGNMELFYGERKSDGTMNWKPLNKKLGPDKNAIVEKPATINNNNSYAANKGTSTSYTINNLANEISTGKRLKIYQDSVMEQRRDFVVCHYKKLSQEDIRKLMQAPFRMSKKDFENYRLPYYAAQSDCFLSYGSLAAFNTEYGYYYFFADRKQADSFLFLSVAAKFIVDSVKRHQTVTIDSRDIDVTVDSTASAGNKKDKKAAINYYAPVEITALGWINCDHFYNAPDGVTPLFTLNLKGLIPESIGVYVIFRDINSMLSEKLYTGGTNKVLINQQLPLNSKVELLVYSKVNNQFVQCKQMVTVTKDMEVPVSLTPVPEGQVKKLFIN